MKNMQIVAKKKDRKWRAAVIKDGEFQDVMIEEYLAQVLYKALAFVAVGEGSTMTITIAVEKLVDVESGGSDGSEPVAY